MRTSTASRAVACGAAALLAAAILSGAGRAAPRSHVVEITGFQFVPARISVAIGDTLVWSNSDIVPHTATAAHGAWDSGTIATKGRWTHVVRERGGVEYLCTLHPTMKGTIVVR